MALAGKTEGKESDSSLAEQSHISRKILHGVLCVIPHTFVLTTSKIRLEGKRTIHCEQQNQLRKQDASLKAYS